jgi:ABC-type antimicrobial peptide transport system permease subunit
MWNTRAIFAMSEPAGTRRAQVGMVAKTECVGRDVLERLVTGGQNSLVRGRR